MLIVITIRWGGGIEGLPIKSPEALKRLRNVKVIIASIFWKEILETIKNIEIDILIYMPMLRDNDLKYEHIIEELNKRTIDLGAFMKKEKEIVCKELTFTTGDSTVLDYAFLKVLAERYGCKSYLEIGTYIGESINILTDCCEKLYSVTAPINGQYSMSRFCQRWNVPDYSERLTYNKKITHFFTDSKLFDFSHIEDEIDLYFIDGDHSYSGVYADTKNIFNIRKDNSIVVWHDFREDGFAYNVEVISAVKDALGNRFENVYVTNCNLCGVYLPDDYIQDFKMRELKYEENAELYTYDVVLKNCQIK